MQIGTNITITGNITQEIDSFLKGSSFSKIGVLVDEHTKTHCYPLLKDHLPIHTLVQIKSGELNKTLKTCELIWQSLTDNQFDRSSLLINLGGGVIGDMGGFCAATFKRGIDFINVPTTLLSQVDASIGGKLGIDFGLFKNHIGLFQEPKRILIDPVFLNTLPERELLSGFAEVIKHALIADLQLWQEIRSKSFEDLSWREIIPKAVQIKERIVAADPKERGLRKILNFGHTVGHAIEGYYLHNPALRLLHGEAIAVGMVAETYLSQQRLNLSDTTCSEIREFIRSNFRSSRIDHSGIRDIGRLATQDKKNRDNKIKAVLLREIAEPVTDVEIGLKEIEESLQYYCDHT